MISLNTYNSIQRQFIRQEKLSSKSKTSHSLEAARQYFQLTRRGKAKRKSLLLFVQWIINQRIKYETVFAQQQTIADDLGIHVRHLRKLIRQLKVDGWLTVIETHGLCNIYILHPIFDDRAFCIGMNYAFNNLLVDKEMYRVMHNSIYVQNELSKKRITDIKEYQYQETVFEDERFVPQKTDRGILDEIFGSTKSDYAKMPSIYKKEYIQKKDTKNSSDISYKIDSDDIDILISNKKEGSIMQDLYSEKIIPYVDELKSIRPTIWGQIKLSAYPKEVVLHADIVTLNCKKQLATAFDRYKYFMSVCATYCRENQISTSWPLAIEIGKQLKMPDLGPFFDESFVPVKAAPNPVKRNSSTVNPYQHNLALVKEYNSILYEEMISGKKPVQQEDPAKTARITANAKIFRGILGLNEDGTFVAGATPEKAIAILAGSSIFKSG
jgi:hypothetical protein